MCVIMLFFLSLLVLRLLVRIVEQLVLLAELRVLGHQSLGRGQSLSREGRNCYGRNVLALRLWQLSPDHVTYATEAS